MVALTMMICSVCMAGCLTRTKVIYARATRLPKETHGLMRLAEEEILVNVIGTDGVATFRTVSPGGYVLVHEQDLAQFVRNTEELQQLRRDRSP